LAKAWLLAVLGISGPPISTQIFDCPAPGIAMGIRDVYYTRYERFRPALGRN